MNTMRTRFIYAYYVLTGQVSYPNEAKLVEALDAIKREFVDSNIINLTVWKEMKAAKIVMEYLDAQGKQAVWQDIAKMLPMEYEHLYDEVIEMIIATKHEVK